MESIHAVPREYPTFASVAEKLKTDHYRVQSETSNPKDTGYKIAGLKQSRGKDFKKGQSGKKARSSLSNSAGSPKKKRKANYHYTDPEWKALSQKQRDAVRKQCQEAKAKRQASSVTQSLATGTDDALQKVIAEATAAAVQKYISATSAASIGSVGQTNPPASSDPMDEDVPLPDDPMDEDKPPTPAPGTKDGDKKKAPASTPEELAAIADKSASAQYGRASHKNRGKKRATLTRVVGFVSTPGDQHTNATVSALRMTPFLDNSSTFPRQDEPPEGSEEDDTPPPRVICEDTDLELSEGASDDDSVHDPVPHVPNAEPVKAGKTFWRMPIIPESEFRRVHHVFDHDAENAENAKNAENANNAE